MKPLRSLSLVALACAATAAAVLTACPGPGPAPTCCPAFSAAVGNEVTQTFPPGGAMQTAWKVRFGHAPSKGLFISGAWFQRAPGAPWMRILWDARVADIFVPYHDNSYRFWDLTTFNFDLLPVIDSDLGCCGHKADDKVVQEVRDRGILWKDHDTASMRATELVLWGTLRAGNYDYLMQYGFRDDGSIGFRLGSTAHNLPGSESVAHMHNALWRVDIDLDGFPHDSALLHQHSEPPGSLTAVDSLVPFNGGKEGFADWDPLQFTELEVQDTVSKNSHGENIAYDLMPMREGSARHYGADETALLHDFWVTRYRPTELFYAQLPTYVQNHEPVLDTDVVIWYASSAHHMPRREDGEAVGGGFHGVALAMWSGFDLRPRNLFDRTPFYP